MTEQTTHPVPTTTFQRPTAVRVSLAGVAGCSYVQGKEQGPNYILLKGMKDKPIYKVDIMAAVIYKEEIGTMTILLLDDSSARVVCRVFEEIRDVGKIQIGEVIHVVGKVREYNQEKYISPEIIRAIDPLWLKIRREVLMRQDAWVVEGIESGAAEAEKNCREEDEPEIMGAEAMLPKDKILQMILELDQGDGVLIEEIIDKSPLENVRGWIDKMLEVGDIFQFQPGRVKVL